MKKRRVIYWAITATLLAAAFLYWWLPAGYDPARVDARLRSLKSPYRSDLLWQKVREWME